MVDEERYRTILEEKEAELIIALRRREGIEVEASADIYDEVQHRLEQDLVIDSLDRESDLLRQVRAAWKRLAGGTYGVCLGCETEISPRRLQAVPWAPLCLQCQEAVDSGQEAGEVLTPAKMRAA